MTTLLPPSVGFAFGGVGRLLYDSRIRRSRRLFHDQPWAEDLAAAEIQSWKQERAASVPTFDGIVVDKAWAQKHPKFMAAFTGVLAKSYADYRANGAKWTADSPQVKGIVKLIGGKPEDIVEALGLLVFPTVEEQASTTWLGGGKESGAARAFAASAKFLKDQKQIDKALDDYSPFVTDQYAKAAAGK